MRVRGWQENWAGKRMEGNSRGKENGVNKWRERYIMDGGKGLAGKGHSSA